MSEPNLHTWQYPVSPEHYGIHRNAWKSIELTDEELEAPAKKPYKKPDSIPYLKEPMTAEQENLITNVNGWLVCPLTVNQFITDLKKRGSELEVACGSNYEVALDDGGNVLPLSVNGDGRVVLKVVEWDMVQEHLFGTRPTVQNLIDMLEPFSAEHGEKLVRGYSHIVPESQQRENPEYVGSVEQYESLVLVGIFESKENNA